MIIGHRNYRSYDEVD